MARQLRTKQDVKSKTPISFGKTKSGKAAKSGTVVEFKDGKKVTLLTPTGKGQKFVQELSSGVKITNNCEPKKDRDGIPISLTAEERAYRAGYLAARKDSAAMYKAKRGGKA